MPLELESLRKTVEALERSVKASAQLDKLDEDLKETIRAGVIQHFEVAYEVCWKFMKRWIEEHVSASAVDGVTRRELFRHAAENKLIADVERWMEHHRSRNLTSHTYDPEVALEVFEDAPRLLVDARAFLVAIEARND